MQPRTLAELKQGQSATIYGFKDAEMSLKLLEMGCLPGTPVRLSSVAPLGCPICIEVSGYQLTLRKSEAATVLIS